jgi:hypothetical protein
MREIIPKDSSLYQAVYRLLDAVVVEDASRFARDLVAQELGLLLLMKRGVSDHLAAIFPAFFQLFSPRSVQVNRLAELFSVRLLGIDFRRC